MGSEPPDARGAGDSSYPPRGYRSKACLGATFHSQFLNENGVPPVCVGVGYRKTSAAPRTEPAAPQKAAATLAPTILVLAVGLTVLCSTESSTMQW